MVGATAPATLQLTTEVRCGMRSMWWQKFTSQPIEDILLELTFGTIAGLVVASLPWLVWAIFAGGQ